jgi:quinol monooxygenase YgiN
MIVVNGHLTISPEHRDVAVAAIAELVPPTVAEDGNISYRYSADLLEPDRINIEEHWESEEAMTAHMATPHLAAFLTAIGPCIGGSVEVVRYDVSGSSKLF